MEIKNFESRIASMVAALEALGRGQHSIDAELEVGDDALGAIEQGINYTMMDLQTLALANQEKDASLELQQQTLKERLAVIEEQRALVAEQERELRAKLETIELQAEAIRELSTPILDIEDDVIALPIVGVLDSRRALDLTTSLLEHIGAQGTRCVILDLTGVDVVDTKTADHLIKVVQATALMGARCVLTGLSPSVAQTLVTIGVDTRGLRTLRSMKDGLRDSLAYLKRRLQRGEER